jgi:hypothetical protein
MNGILLYRKCRAHMTTTFERLPVVTTANDVPGPKQGLWTYNDYATLPDDGQHYEIVNGVLFMTPSPSIAHQEAAFEIASYLRAHVKLAGLGRVFMSLVDVELAPNVVVQPDVVVILNTSLGKSQRHASSVPPNWSLRLHPLERQVMIGVKNKTLMHALAC